MTKEDQEFKDLKKYRIIQQRSSQGDFSTGKRPTHEVNKPQVNSIQEDQLEANKEH